MLNKELLCGTDPGAGKLGIGKITVTSEQTNAQYQTALDVEYTLQNGETGRFSAPLGKSYTFEGASPIVEMEIGCYLCDYDALAKKAIDVLKTIYTSVDYLNETRLISNIKVKSPIKYVPYVDLPPLSVVL